MTVPQPQCTIGSSVVQTGFGYWSGRDVTVEFRPAPADSGVTFVRRDLGPHARLAVAPGLRTDTPRRTNLRSGDVTVEMVEHILAALAGLQIDNCEVWVDQPEMPGCDGSALPFVEKLLAADIVPQNVPARTIQITAPLRIEEGPSWIAAYPAVDDCLSIEFLLDYPAHKAIGRQSIATTLSPDRFRSELAPCRTFLLESEAEQLVEQGVGRRVTTSDLLVFNEKGPVGNQLRFTNECARHKALDVLGDLALTGQRIVGKVVAHRSSHRLNARFAEQLVDRFACLDQSWKAAG